MSELEAVIKELDTVVTKIKEVNQKVKDILKEVVLEGDKLNKLTAKAVKSKIPNTTEKLTTRIFNVQKYVLVNLQFKSQGFATAEMFSKDPEMFEQLKIKRNRNQQKTNCKFTAPFGFGYDCISSLHKKDCTKSSKATKFTQ
ncbi:hypothetical protein DSO57_1018154 [Entomophthora muscae]|uniref:Uncharacterized protein n=1 Tax=Entomophthora muscae TaxID=34485 RepID=A0ACC2STS0_9FUNG|nr:hypothetical protein DSO57_1018154 [Entomophthora muscae]